MDWQTIVMVVGFIGMLIGWGVFAGKILGRIDALVGEMKAIKVDLDKYEGKIDMIRTDYEKKIERLKECFMTRDELKVMQKAIDLNANKIEANEKHIDRMEVPERLIRIETELKYIKDDVKNMAWWKLWIN